MNYRPANWDRMTGDERVAWVEAKREQRVPGPRDPSLRFLGFQDRARAKLLRRFANWRLQQQAEAGPEKTA